jgi:hypothetical protein
VVKRYKYDAFDLLLRVIDKRGVRLSETVIFNFVPDPYRVYFNVHKVEINEDCIRVINQNGELTKEFVLERPGLNTVH